MEKVSWFSNDELERIAPIIVENLDRSPALHYLSIGQSLYEDRLFVLPESCQKILGMRFPLANQHDTSDEAFTKEGRRFCSRIVNRLLQHFRQPLDTTQADTDLEMV